MYLRSINYLLFVIAISIIRLLLLQSISSVCSKMHCNSS